MRADYRPRRAQLDVAHLAGQPPPDERRTGVEEVLARFAAASGVADEAAAELAAVRVRLAQVERTGSRARLEAMRQGMAELGDRIMWARKLIETLRSVRSEDVSKLRIRLDVLAAEACEADKTLHALYTRSLQARRRGPGPVPPDADGADLRPDPRLAATKPEFMAALRRYRAWAGDVSFRQMSRRAGSTVGASTLCTALNKDALPRLDVVLAVVNGCGGSEEDRQRFATAWRALRLPPGKAPARPLRSVPTV